MIEHTATLGYYDVLDDFEVNEAFTAYEGATLNEIDEFPKKSIILVIDTDTDG